MKSNKTIKIFFFQFKILTLVWKEKKNLFILIYDLFDYEFSNL